MTIVLACICMVSDAQSFKENMDTSVNPGDNFW